MGFKIGFVADYSEKKSETPVIEEPRGIAPRKSVVQVSFPGRGSSLAYYNDQFDLHVDGKLEGQRGRVVEVAYNFKIKVFDYKREVHGQFFNAGSHFITFDRAALPQSKIVTWYKAPAKEDDEYVSGSDDSCFCLDDLKNMKISTAIAGRSHDYYMENRVRYISIDGTKGYAIVEGTEAN